MEINFCLFHLPLWSNYLNFRLSHSSHPVKSSLGSMVTGGEDPANFHALWNSGERMIATPLKRWWRPFAAQLALWRKMWYPPLSTLKSSLSFMFPVSARYQHHVSTCSWWYIQVWTGRGVHQQGCYHQGLVDRATDLGHFGFKLWYVQSFVCVIIVAVYGFIGL